MVQQPCIPKDYPIHGEENRENDQGDQERCDEEVTKHEVDRRSSIKSGGYCADHILGIGRSIRGLAMGLGCSETKSGIVGFPWMAERCGMECRRQSRVEFVVPHVGVGRHP